MNKSEILNLHTLSEDEQTEWLIRNEVLQPVNTRDYTFGTITRIPVWESLADCAFRLRDELAKDTIVWNMSVTELQLLCRKLKCSMAMATPIMWIQAALLATLESEVNDE